MATFTQDEYKIRSIDVVHINPSLLEGEVNYTSIIGPDRAVQLERYAPTNLIAPVISGPETIPGVLSCFPGVWDGAPTPSYTYQWFSDGNPIVGETTNTLSTLASMSDTDITCGVTATNTSGSEGEISNAITVSLIEPIRLEEYENYAIDGLNQETQQNMMVFRGAIVSGMWNDPRFDMMNMSVLPITGMFREDRFDMMSMVGCVTNGWGVPTLDTVHHTESYVTQFPVFDKAMTVLNPSAADGTNHWTADPAQPDGADGVMIVDSFGHTDSTCFGGPQGTPKKTDYYQDIAIDPADYADVDGKNCAVYVKYWDYRIGNYDYAGMYYEALDSNDVSIGVYEVAGRILSPYKDAWSEKVSGVQDIPAGTRKIRLHMVFTNHIFNNIDTRIDDVSLDLYKFIVAT